MPFTLTTEAVFWIVCVLGLLSIANIVGFVVLTKKIKRLLGGTQATNIEEALGFLRKELDGLKGFKAEVNTYLKTVEERLKRSVQSVETVRFNPFKGTGDGGNQSFSTAFVDENGNGVVVSGLYSRERVSIFSKAVKHFTSEFELTEEEQAVIKNSQKKLSAPNK